MCIESTQFRLDEFTQQIANELGLNVDFTQLNEYNPDAKMVKRWEKLTHGTFYNVAPAYFVPSDERGDSIATDLSIDNKLAGLADLSAAEEKFLNALNDPNAEFIEKLLWRYLPMPLTHLHMIDDIGESIYYNLKGTNSVYQNAIDNFNTKLDTMTAGDLFAVLRKSAYAPRFSVHIRYLSHFDSKKCIEKWLQFQFAQNVQEFVSVLYKIITRSNGKKNCIWLHGPGNAGKTHAMKALCSLFISVGHVKSIEQAATQFPFQGLHNKRIALLDEFKIPTNYVDEFKELLGGESLAINLKYKTGMIETNPMPFICMSNSPPNVDMTDVVWNSRIAEFKVKSLPPDMFNSNGFHLYPLAWLDIFEAHGFK